MAFKFVGSHWRQAISSTATNVKNTWSAYPLGQIEIRICFLNACAFYLGRNVSQPLYQAFFTSAPLGSVISLALSYKWQGSEGNVKDEAYGYRYRTCNKIANNSVDCCHFNALFAVCSGFKLAKHSSTYVAYSDWAFCIVIPTALRLLASDTGDSNSSGLISKSVRSIAGGSWNS
jgi:hypothetical protein